MAQCPKCGAANVDGATTCAACASPLTPMPIAGATMTGSGMPTTRPTGITILAVLSFIGAGLCAIAAIFAFLGGAMFGALFGSMLGAGEMGAAAGAAIGIMIGIFVLALGALYAVTGWAFWTAKPWGWILGLVLSGLSVLSGVTNLAQGEWSSILGVALSGFIIWYLLQPGVKRYFGRPA